MRTVLVVLIERFVKNDDFNKCKEEIAVVEKGEFGADMKVELINDGPVTITYDTDLWLG